MLYDIHDTHIHNDTGAKSLKNAISRHCKSSHKPQAYVVSKSHEAIMPIRLPAVERWNLSTSLRFDTLAITAPSLPW